MGPIELATVTTAVVNLSLEAAKDVAPVIFKDTWKQVKGWLGFTKEPSPAELAPEVARLLHERSKDDAALATKIIDAIGRLPESAPTRICGGVHVQNGQVQLNVTIRGPQHNAFTFNSPPPPPSSRSRS